MVDGVSVVLIVGTAHVQHVARHFAHATTIEIHKLHRHVYSNSNKPPALYGRPAATPPQCLLHPLIGAIEMGSKAQDIDQKKAQVENFNLLLECGCVDRVAKVFVVGTAYVM